MLKQNIPHAAQPPISSALSLAAGLPLVVAEPKTPGLWGKEVTDRIQNGRGHRAVRVWYLSRSLVTCEVGISVLNPISTVPHWDGGSVGGPGAVAWSWAAAQAYPVVPAAHENLCPRGCHVSCLSLAREFHRSPPAQELPQRRPFPSIGVVGSVGHTSWEVSMQKSLVGCVWMCVCVCVRSSVCAHSKVRTLEVDAGNIL